MLGFKYLLDIDNKDRNLLNAPKNCLLFGNRKKYNEKVKALTLRKELMIDYLRWLRTVSDQGEISISRRNNIKYIESMNYYDRNSKSKR